MGGATQLSMFATLARSHSIFAKAQKKLPRLNELAQRLMLLEKFE
jgi:hypothetical protein